MSSNEAGRWMAEEVASQPDMWELAVSLAKKFDIARPGARMAVIGCGTSFYMAQAFAQLRERLGFGQTDAFAASEYLWERNYDVVVALTRSGTTTEILDTTERLKGTTKLIGIVGDPNTPFVNMVDELVSLDFADEQSVVQTRFATSALALLRTGLGEDLTDVIAQARDALTSELPEAVINAEQYSFLGVGWGVGIAQEAALKMREAAQVWTEAYSAHEYRHGPMSIAQPGRVTWQFGSLLPALARDVKETGAHFEHGYTDPMVELIRVHRATLETALERGLNPDTPRNLTRSVILR